MPSASRSAHASLGTSGLYTSSLPTQMTRLMRRSSSRSASTPRLAAAEASALWPGWLGSSAARDLVERSLVDLALACKGRGRPVAGRGRSAAGRGMSVAGRGRAVAGRGRSVAGRARFGGVGRGARLFFYHLAHRRRAVVLLSEGDVAEAHDGREDRRELVELDARRLRRKGSGGVRRGGRALSTSRRGLRGDVEAQFDGSRAAVRRRRRLRGGRSGDGGYKGAPADRRGARHRRRRRGSPRIRA